MLQVSQTSVPIWPITGDVPNLQTIIDDQAETITQNEALLHAYQVNLNAAQTNPPGTAATANGTTSGTSTSLVVAAPVTGTIVTGATVTGVGVPTGVTILGEISGTAGGAGTYLTNVALALGTSTALTFTPPPTEGTWPAPTDAPTLLLISQQQTAILRTQSALLQHYVDLMNTSQTNAPPTGP